MTHTPRPWIIQLSPDARQVYIVDAKGDFVALVKAPDADLIVAAPDLLDALRGVMFFVPEGTLARERGDAALAKAEGRE